MGMRVDTTTIYGRLQFNILASIGEFERGLIRERSREGREKALARGVKFGAKPKLSKEDLGKLVRDFEAPGCSKVEIAEHYGISRSSVYRVPMGIAGQQPEQSPSCLGRRPSGLRAGPRNRFIFALFVFLPEFFGCLNVVLPALLRSTGQKDYQRLPIPAEINSFQKNVY
jgi:hypothetical protein